MMWLSKLLWRTRTPAEPSRIPLSFYNTLTRANQEFTLPPIAHTVRMYNCGPTVYDTSHIGNLRSYVFADTVRRALEYNDYKVKQVINITDFGHLSSDADLGNDKMSMALKREGKELTLENMRALAEKYTEEFIRDLKALNVDTNSIIFPRASDHIQDEVRMVKTLEEKGYTYTGADGVYFDTSKYAEYGKLGAIDIKGLREGARVAVAEDKRSPTDFLLWKKDEHVGWESPWGRGFPGWHIECSAMIRATLGEQIDIHTGGIDLMPTHHNNEIAQSEIATGKKPFSRFWLHHEFLNLDQEKISKSIGNVINLPAVIEKGFHPLAYRYFLLGAHYRTTMNFTWESLDAASTAFLRLQKIAQESPEGGVVPIAYIQRMHARINDDLDTPGVLAAVWEMVKDAELSPADVRAGLLQIDAVLGLGFATLDASVTTAYRQKFGHTITIENAPTEIRTLIEAREIARKEKDWKKSDEIRDQIAKAGYAIEDTAEGLRISQRV